MAEAMLIKDLLSALEVDAEYHLKEIQGKNTAFPLSYPELGYSMGMIDAEKFLAKMIRENLEIGNFDKTTADELSQGAIKVMDICDNARAAFEKVAPKAKR